MTKLNDSKDVTSARALSALNQMQVCIAGFQAMSDAYKAFGEQLRELNQALWDLCDEEEQLSIALSEYADARDAHEAITRPQSGFGRARVTAHDHPAAVRLREARAKLETLRLFRPHSLYNKSDADVPASICDRNGDVVLGLCKACGKGERDLLDNGGHCNGAPKPTEENGNAE